jgi:hypothetical protein
MTLTQHFKFAVIGDFGINSTEEGQVVSLIDSWQPDLILTTGDNNYPSGEFSTIPQNIEQYFSKYITKCNNGIYTKDLVIRFIPTLGNHDWTNVQAHSDFFCLPGNERYFLYHYLNTDFYILNSNSDEPDGIDINSAQYNWFKKQTDESRAPLKFVFLHHPPFTSPSTHSDSLAMQWPFKASGINAVFAGHNHFYERLVFDDLLYFVNGAGGAPLYSRTGVSQFSNFFYNQKHGAMLVSVTKSSVKFEFFSIDGQKIDMIEVNY